MIPWPWPAPDDDGAADHLRRGQLLPDIALSTTGARQLALADIQGRAVVFVYPYTGRPGVADPPGWDRIAGAHGSTAQAEGFRNLVSSFASLDTAVYGLSSQSVAWQRELIERLSLGFECISDEAMVLAQVLKLPTFVAGSNAYYKRLTLLVRDGEIEMTFYPVHPPDAHARDVLACLTDLVGYELEGRINS